MILVTRQLEFFDQTFMSIMRDPVNDYGEAWLEEHYQENHLTLEQAIQDTRRRVDDRSNR